MLPDAEDISSRASSSVYSQESSPDDDLSAIKALLRGTQTTPGKARALLDFQESTSDAESDQDEEGSSSFQDPWYQEAELPGHAGNGLSLGRPVRSSRRLMPYAPVVTNLETQDQGLEEQYQIVPRRHTEVNALDDEPSPVTQAVEELEMAVSMSKGGKGKGRARAVILFPFRLIGAMGLYTKNTIKHIGTVLLEIPEAVRQGMKPGETSESREVVEAEAPTMVHSLSAAPRRPPSAAEQQVNRFELFLKKAFFEETTAIVTTLAEPNWDYRQSRPQYEPFFPGWFETMDEYILRPQGLFVAETKKALDDFLEHVELGVDLQVMGTGGGLSSTGLPSLLKRSFTPYQWLGMWRSSEGRHIQIARVAFNSPKNLSGLDNEMAQSMENEILGLDKYRGGDSEYLTVVTYSDDFIGAISLFRADLSDKRKVMQLGRVAMIPGVPRKICSILRDEIKPNRYVVGRSNRKLKCFDCGDLPRPQIVKVTNKRYPWKGSGGGWRKALSVPELFDEYSSGQGLIATIPQMIGLLHLQHITLTRLQSSPAHVFETPISISGKNLFRGVFLNEIPKGLAHIGGNTRIAILYPRDSAWVREQFFWA
ncbi:hypothetical protein NM208_g8160 [Fusarium decemcellulare]|uniref:Uncharacterized protein n=1 Tax=Fusarium decemcellulare TaxID=57161 RepID=A0ACC1S6C4_9HYPO|nr:hypothetical protein NM208_g8160 [Fusarium decemcellulare]